MDTTSLLLILTLILNATLVAVILASNRHRLLNILAATFIGAICLWVGSIFFLRITLNPIYGNLAFAAAALIPAGLYAFIHNFPRPRFTHRHAIMLVLVPAVFVTASLIQGLMFSGGVELINNSIVPEHTGPLLPFYLGYFLVYVGLTVSAAIRSFRHSSGLERAQAKYIFWGIGAAVILSVICSLILPLFGAYTLNAVSPLASVILAIAIAYAIIRHRFLDVRVLVARTLAYALLLGTLALVYVGGALALSRLFYRDEGLTTSQIITNALLSVILVFLFQPLRQFFERITNNIFYRHHYDSEVVLSDFTKVLVSELNLERLLKHALTNLCESLHVEFGQIIVYKHDRVYRIEHYGPLPRRLMIAPELARLNKPLLIADELGEGERKKLLEGHGVRVSLMLRAREEFVGYLLLGDKLSGDIYSNQDIEVLEIMGKEMAVATLNAKAYAEIEELNFNLQGRVERATKRLRTANRHLKELDRAKDEFISMASHQLRTPLTTIKGYLSMMLEGDAGKLTAAQKDFVSYAFGSSERMVNLISDLLNVSRLQAGRFLIQTKPTDLVRMINDEVRQLEEHARSKGISLSFQLPEKPLPQVEIDENKTRQVIMNFIDNAIYYTQKGGVTVVLQQAGSRLRFEVRDTGIGVPPAARKKLFSKFYRAENAQTVRPDGTGLGLYLAKRVVEDQGGIIIFESVEGEGSTFGFELPYNPVGAKDSHAVHPAKPKRDHASHSHSK